MAIKGKYLLGCVVATLSVAVCLSACSGSSSKRLSINRATGKPGEAILVIDNNTLNTQGGRSVLNLLESDVPALPQVEPNFSVSIVPPTSFQDFLRYVRSVVMVDVDPDRYSRTSLQYGYNEWADGQIVLRLQTASADSLESYVGRNKEALLNMLLRHELYRFAQTVVEQPSLMADAVVDSLFAHHINVPNDIRSKKIGKDFLWMSNAAMRRRHDILVYSYPYTSPSDIGLDRMVAVRDSVLKANIEGEFEGSYPTTEKEYGLLYRKVMGAQGCTRGEVRGLWKMEGGSMMGGPFVCQSYVDSAEQKVYVVEGFVYRPNEKKRDMIRLMEASLYTFRPRSQKVFDPKSILQTSYSKIF